MTSTAPRFTTEELAAHLRSTLAYLKGLGLRDDVALKVVHDHVYGRDLPALDDHYRR